MKSFYLLFTLSLTFTQLIQAGDKVLPVLNSPIADLTKDAYASPHSINLDTIFGTETIDDQVVRFTSQASNGTRVMDFALFSNRTPLTRTNFLKYVTDGDYNNSFIHRSAPGFVIQGGGFYSSSPSSELPFSNVPTDNPITNEFGVSNTQGTISMAKSGGDPHSATSQWFVSLGANSDNLDNQNGGFTVFGRVTKSTINSAEDFGDNSLFPITDKSADHSAMDNLPLIASYTGGTVSNTDLILFPSVSLAAMTAGDAGESTTLIYSILSNSDPSLINASIITGNQLQLSYPSQTTGEGTISIKATDSVGNTVVDTFTITLHNAYTSWRLTHFSESDAADDAISAPDVDHNNDGVSNLELYVHGLSTTEKHQAPVVFSTISNGLIYYPVYTVPLANLNGISLDFQKSSDLGKTDPWVGVAFGYIDYSTQGNITTYRFRSIDPAPSEDVFYRFHYSLTE